MKVRIFSPVCNNPEFIKLQAKTFERFLDDDYDYIVLNDGLDPGLVSEISKVCQELSIECVEVPKSLIHSSAAVAHSAVMQWAYDNIILGKYVDDICVFVDSDMFAIRDFSISSFVGDNALCGVPQHRGPIEYFWPGLLFMNIPLMPNKEDFNVYCGIVRGFNVDAGGIMWHYLNENRGINLKGIQHTSHIHSCNSNMHVLCNEVLERYDEEFRIEILESSFLHYGGASTRNFPDRQKRKREFVGWLLAACIDNSIKMPEVDFVFNKLRGFSK